MNLWYTLLSCCFLLSLAKQVQGRIDVQKHLQPDDVDEYDTLSPEDETNSSCVRECIEGEPPRICYYKFVVEKYNVLNAACDNCTINVTDCYNPQCVTANGYERGILTANRKLPGPGIQVCIGDRVIVDVVNEMSGMSTSIHWHGIFLKGQPHNDGVPMVTQCPILNGNTFRYDFFVNNPGSFFWHSHDGFQKMNGLTGNLIVREPKSKDPNSHLYDYDLPNHVVHIKDWNFLDADQHYPGLRIHDKSQEAESYLVSGRGRYKRGTEESKTPLAVYKVEKGKRYRFRFIGALCTQCPVRVMIEHHELTVIAVDGNPIKPTIVSSLVLLAGVRYDVVVHANRELQPFWIRFQGLNTCTNNDVQQLAVLFYEGSTHAEPLTTPITLDSYPHFKELNAENANCTGGMPGICIHQLEGYSVPKVLKEEPDVKLLIDFNMHVFTVDELFFQGKYIAFQQPLTPTLQLAGQLNNISGIVPSSPLLSQAEDVPADAYCPERPDGTTYCPTNYCHCINRLKVPLGAVVQIFLNHTSRNSTLNHPFHLHGHKFAVLLTGNFTDNKTVDDVLDMVTERAANTSFIPPMLDTITVPNYGFAVIRFIADNPGYWFFHCHIAIHHDTGMNAIVQVGENSEHPKVPKNFPRCSNYIPEVEDVTNSRLSEHLKNRNATKNVY